MALDTTERLAADVIVHPTTGEVIDTETLDRADLIALVAELQDLLRAVREACQRAQQALIRHMEADRAIIAEAGEYEARIRYEARPDVRILLGIREHVTPEEFEEAFRVEYRPMKRALNELAKRGGILRDIIEAGYVRVPSLIVERKGGES